MFYSSLLQSQYFSISKMRNYHNYTTQTSTLFLCFIYRNSHNIVTIFVTYCNDQENDINQIVSVYTDDNSSSQKQLKRYDYNNQDGDINPNKSVYTDDNFSCQKQSKRSDYNNQDVDIIHSKPEYNMIIPHVRNC